jgi:hypothetical protein
MPATINADNGVVSGSAGVKTTADTSGELALQSNGNTGLTLNTSLNVGIGTSSPGYRLDVNGIINGNNSIISRRASGSQPEFVLTQTGVASWAMYNPPSSTDLRFNNGNDLLTLNSSGNLGLGVTPSVWSQGKAFEISAAGEGLWGNGLGDIWMMNGAYFNSGWKYSGTTRATAYRQGAGTTDGSHSWHVAPSGTAGNAITFTQAMTLSNSGALGFGNTPSYGSSGQVLTSGGSGAAPTWTTPSAGAVSFVSSVIASGASTVSFTGLTSTPAYYFIEFDGVIGSSGGTFECVLSTDNGASYIASNYRFVFLWSEANSSGANATTSTTGTRIVLANNAVSTNSNFPTRGIVQVLGAGSPRAVVQYELSVQTTASNLGYSTGSGMPDTTSGVNAIRFRFGSGTITGNFRLYSVSST